MFNFLKGNSSAPVSSKPDDAPLVPVESKVERNHKIIKEYKAGATSIELGEKYQISSERICQILRPHGAIEDKQAERFVLKLNELEAKFAKRRERREKAERAAQMVSEGMSMREASLRVGLRQKVVESISRNYGIKSKHGRWSRIDYPERKRIITEMRAEGKTWAEISGRLVNSSIYPWARLHMPELFPPKDAK